MPDATALPDDAIRFGIDDFRRMMDALPMCIILHDAQSKSILWANPRPARCWASRWRNCCR
jgi:hypothetical protein